MSKLIKLFLPLALVSYGLKASQKEQAQKIDINSYVRTYLEAKCAILKLSKSGYLYNKIQTFLNDLQPTIISDTVEHGIYIHENNSNLDTRLKNNIIGDFLATDGSIKPFIGHLANALKNIENISLDKKFIYSRNEQYILTRSDDGTARVWDRVWGTSRILIGHSGAVTAIDFSPNSNAVLTGGWDHKIIYWNLENSKIIPCFGHSNPIARVKFISNNNFYSISSDNEKKFWTIENGNISPANEDSKSNTTSEETNTKSKDDNYVLKADKLTTNSLHKSRGNTLSSITITNKEIANGCDSRSVYELVKMIGNQLVEIEKTTRNRDSIDYDRPAQDHNASLREMQIEKSKLHKELNAALTMRCKTDSYIKEMNNIKTAADETQSQLSLSFIDRLEEKILLLENKCKANHESWNHDNILKIEAEILDMTDNKTKKSLLQRIDLIKKKAGIA